MKSLIKPLALSVFIITAACSSGDDSAVLVKIEGDETITVQDFKSAYQTIVDQIKVTARISDDKLQEFSKMSREEVAGMPPTYQELWMRLQPEAAYEDLKRMKIINRHAREKGFTNRDDIKKKVKLLAEQAIMQLYLLEAIKTPDFTDEQLGAECERIRNTSNNPQVQAMTASQCFEQAKSSLAMQNQQLEMSRLVKSITESYRVKENNEAVDKFIRGKSESAQKPAEEKTAETKAEKEAVKK